MTATLGQLKTLYDSGMSRREVAEFTGLPEGTVQYRLFVTLGLTPRRRGTQPKSIRLPWSVYQETERLYWDEDLFAWEVAEKMGVGESAVHARLRKSPRGTRSHKENSELIARRKAAGTYRVCTTRRPRR